MHIYSCAWQLSDCSEDFHWLCELELLGDGAGMVSFTRLCVEDMLHSEIKYIKLECNINDSSSKEHRNQKHCVLTIWAIIGLKNKG